MSTIDKEERKHNELYPKKLFVRERERERAARQEQSCSPNHLLGWLNAKISNGKQVPPIVSALFLVFFQGLCKGSKWFFL